MVTQTANNAIPPVAPSLEAPLTWVERIRIVSQVGTAMVAGALLLIGWVQWQYGAEDLRNVAELIVALAACLVAAPIFWEAAVGLCTGNKESATYQLVALAILAAMMMGTLNSFYTAALIAVIMNLGRFLEERSILGAQAAIEGLKKLHTTTAMVLVDGQENEVDASRLKPGDTIVVRPGDIIAADGEIIKGDSSLDQSSITGESIPADMGPGNQVFAGSVNLTGLLQVRVTGAGAQTALGRIVQLLQQAERSKTPTMKLIETYAGYYVPLILIIAAVVLFITRDMERAVTVLVVACPSALVLAGPMAMVSALSTASRLGVLIKNTRFLESLGDVDSVVLDKTGTVTLGQLQLVESQPRGATSEDALLANSLVCAEGSRHPVSRAIVQAAAAAGVKASRIPHQVHEVHGKGVIAECDEVTYRLGRRQWLKDEGWEVPEDPRHSGPVVWLGSISKNDSGGEVKTLGCLLLADVPRAEAREAIGKLRELGVSRLVLLTGDRRHVAEEIGSHLEVDEVAAEVLPQQKLEIIERECADNTVMMVGDGVNDALALARGDVGVAIGAAGSDVALQSADVALMSDDLGRMPTTISLARRTRRIIHQNVLVGVGLSLSFIYLASIGLFGPVVGILLHFAGPLFVVCNSARLLGFEQSE
ncbi:MAG: heavy metal translocating P-type ATPase [Planctomycetota bacterium]